MEPSEKKDTNRTDGVEPKDTWSDREIETTSDDRFGFDAYAEMLESRLTEVGTPLTIGIFGQWGSGKSSLMKMTRDLLDCEEKGGPVQCIWINVWQLSSQDEVWQAFLQALFSQVQRKLSKWQRINKRKLAYQIASSLLRFALVATPLIIGLLIGSNATDLNQLAADAIAAGGMVATLGLFLLAAARIGPVVDAFRQTVKIDLQAALKGGSYEARISELTELQGHFANMVELLVGEDGKLVVFIDDLDRCTPDKVPEVLEAIKLFTTTPGCIYIIGLDHDIVRQGIETKYDFMSPEAATEYLEKIVQVPFYLPPLDVGRIERFVRDFYPDLQDQSPNAAVVFSNGLEPNPRKVKRALNIYRMLLDLKEMRFETWEVDEVENELVAKMVVIQSRYRRLDGHLFRHPDFLLQLERWANPGLFLVEDVPGEEKEIEQVGKLLLGEPETKDKPAKKGLVDTASLGALQRLLQTGAKKFNDPDQENKIDSYIYLIATVEGGAEGLQPNREDREILLSGNKVRIREQIDKILGRGQDEQVRQQIRAELIKRLNLVMEDSRKSFTPDQRSSARAALSRLEILPLLANERSTIPRRLDDILAAGAGEVEKERIRLQYISRLEEDRLVGGLYSSEEQESARIARERLVLLPLIGSKRSTIRVHVDAIRATSTHDPQTASFNNEEIFLKNAAGADSTFYTPEEQDSARIALTLLEILPLLGGGRAAIRKGLDDILEAGPDEAARERIRVNYIESMKAIQGDSALYTPEEQNSAGIAQERLEILPLLGGGRTTIREGIDGILAAGVDEAAEKGIRADYISRLDAVLGDSELYTPGEQASARMALARLALLPLLGGDRAGIRQRLDDILVTDLDTAEQQDFHDGLIERLEEAREDSELYTPEERTLAGIAQARLVVLPLLGGDRLTIRKRLDDILAAGAGEVEKERIRIDYCEGLKAVQADSDLYTPEEQVSARIARERLELLPFLGGERPTIRKRLDDILATPPAGFHEEELREETIERLKAAQDDAKLYTSEEQDSARIAQGRLEMLALLDGDRPTIRKRFDDILAAGAGEAERERTRLDCIERLQAVQDDAKLYIPDEQALAGDIQARLEIVPLLSGGRSTMRKRLGNILDETDQGRILNEQIDQMQVVQADAGLYTPAEQELSHSVLVALMYMRLFSELPIFDDERGRDDGGSDDLGLDENGTRGRLLGILDGLGAYGDGETVLANHILDVMEGWTIEASEPQTVRVPAGPFLMGSSDEQIQRWIDEGHKEKLARWEKPKHNLLLSDYRIGRYPVTMAQYQAFIQDSAHAPPIQWRISAPTEKDADHPVTWVEKEDAQAYCKWLQERTGRHYRLLTEAEWEKAARGVDGRLYPWGNEFDPAKANTKGTGRIRTSPVKRFPEGASPYGVLDMIGNVWEWTSTLWGRGIGRLGVGDPDFIYPYQPDDGREEAGGFRHIVRGGAYDTDRPYCALRNKGSKPIASGDVGFRVAVSITRSSKEGLL